MFLGTPKEPGILPRVLHATFHHIGGRQYEGMDLKPYLRNDAQYLDPDQVKQERSAKAAIFASVKEVRFFFYPTWDVSSGFDKNPCHAYLSTSI